MKAFLLISVLIALLVGGAVGFFLDDLQLLIDVRKQYGERRSEFRAMAQEISPMTPREQALVAEIESSCYIMHKLAPSNPIETVREALQITQYPNTIDGLLANWTDEMPPFSFWDMEQNKLWLIRAEMRIGGMGFPPTGVSYYRGENLIFSDGTEVATIWRDSPTGVVETIYYRRKESYQELLDYKLEEADSRTRDYIIDISEELIAHGFTTEERTVNIWDVGKYGVDGMTLGIMLHFGILEERDSYYFLDRTKYENWRRGGLGDPE